MVRIMLLALIASSGTIQAGQAPVRDHASAEQLFKSASEALQAGRYLNAEQGFRQVLVLDPGNVASLGNLGVLYSRSHRFADAIEADQRALKLVPDDPDLLLNIGLAYLKQQQYEKARRPFERLDKLGIREPRPALLLATCMILGDAPKDGLALIQQRKLEAQDKSALYLEAVAYARLNQLDKSTAIFQSLLSTDATRARATFLLGQAMHDGHRLPEAVEYLTETLRIEPGHGGAHRELGKVYISQQNFELAERELKLALKQDPEDPSALYFLGAMLVQNAHEAEGVPYLVRAQTLSPDSWAIPFYLGKSALRQGEPERAVLLLQKAAGMNADEPEVFYLLANALRLTGHPEEAKAAMARVQTLHSSALDAERRAMNRKVVGSE